MSIFLSTAVLFYFKEKLCFKTQKFQNQERKNNGVNKNQEGELYHKWSFATTQLLAGQGNTTLEKWWWLEAMFSGFLEILHTNFNQKGFKCENSFSFQKAVYFVFDTVPDNKYN